MPFEKQNKEETSQKSETEIPTERDAVAGAMLQAQQRLLQLAEEKYGKSKINEFWYIKKTDSWENLSLEEQLRESTAGMCEWATAMAIAYLIREKELLFDDFFILEGLNAPRYGTHAYFVAKGKGGAFFAGSPANTQVSEANLTDIFDAETLPELVQKIFEKDGGRWPNTQIIEEILQKNSKSYSGLKNDEVMIKTFCPDFHNREEDKVLTIESRYQV